jgi:hypothetical protein
MTEHPDLFAALAAPFEPSEVKLRAAPGGRQLHYITARTAMNRLDSVLGPENWWDDYQPQENSVICRLTVRLPDGQTVTKGDAGGYAGMADQGDDDKSGYSDAFKRAAAKFGVARYLYRDGVPSFVQEREPGAANVPEPPAASAPSQARPSTTGQSQAAQPARPPQQRAASPNGNGQPRNGRAMFAWVKEQEQTHEVGLLKYLNGWSKLQDFPGRMVDWDEEQVAAGYAEAVRKIQSIQPSRSGNADPYDDALANGSAPSGASGGGAVSQPAPDATEPSADVKQLQGLFRVRLEQVARLQNPHSFATTPGQVAQALSCLCQKDAQGRRLITISDCYDMQTLGDFCTIAEFLIEDLRATEKSQGQSTPI